VPGGTAERAIEFLLRSQDDDGGWRDWKTHAGISDEWVTAYAGCALAGWPERTAHGGALRAFEFLRSRRPYSDGWAYNGGVPPDADSTVWACRLARALDRGNEAAPALAFLHGCRRPDGGLATYACADGLRRAMGFGPEATFCGWLQSHTCVTAAAAALPEFGGDSSVLTYLRRQQHADGHWEGYWWPDPEYTTALAVEALRARGDPDVLRAIAVAVAWERSRPIPAPPFLLACRFRIVCGHDSARSRELARQLHLLQQNDGSWPSSSRIRIPPPDIVQPSAIWNWDDNRTDLCSIRMDQARVFTTATVLSALRWAP